MRDGFRCVVTKAYDAHIVKVNKELEELAVSSGVWPEATYCAHIFPESTNANITPGSDEVVSYPT